MDIPTMDIPCFDLNFEPCDVDKENSCSTSRFPQLSESDVQSIEDGRLEASTKRATKWGVQIFKEWLKERQHDEMFEGLPDDQLDEFLRQFYGEVRTKKGNQYGKSAMAGIRSAINRHLGGAPFNRNINIITDPKFRRSNNMFVGLIKQMKKEGLDKTKHHTAISDEDLKKLYSSDVFNNETPVSLLRKVWFNVTFYFGRRGSEGQRRLTKDSFTVGRDDAGREFVEMSVNEKEKNHPGTTSDGQHKQSRMYNIPDDEANCPVFAFKLYMEKLNPKSNTFFQRPLNTKPNDESSPWFMNAVVGEKKLQGMMKEISQLAKLSCVYTNHCIRATTCTVLDKAGHKTHEIMAVTGHKSESSVRSYVNRLSSGQKRQLSDNLSAQCVSSQSQVYTPTSNSLVLHYENTMDQRNDRPRTDEELNVRPPGPSTSTRNTNLSMSFEEQSIALSSIFQGCNFRAPVNVTVNTSS